MSPRHSFRGAAMAMTVAAALAASFAIASAAGTAAPAAAAAAPAAAAGALKGDAAAGKTKFMTMCIACHKKDGTGGFKVTGNPTANWTLKKTWDATRTDAYLRDCINNGKPKDGMVAWGKTGQLKPQQIEDLIAFIKTFKAAAK